MSTEPQAIVSTVSLRDVASELDRLRKVVNAQTGRQLQSNGAKDGVRAFVQTYFRAARPDLARVGINTSVADTQMQRLLELANHNSSISQYKTTIATLRTEIGKIEAETITAMSDLAVRGQSQQVSVIESRVLSTLGGMLPSTARSYQQVLLDLAADGRVSYRGTATELREILRETLDYLAPDKDVMAADGFQLEKDRPKPTMAQKARYILRKRGVAKNSIEVPRKSIEIVETTVSTLVRSTYDRGSIDTHTSTGIDKPGVQQLKMYVDSVLGELLEIHKA